VCWRQRLEDDQTYVLDLLQMPDGRRFLQPRLADATTCEYAVLSSKAYCGGELMSWREYGRVDQYVELKDGGHFVLDPHGIWLTMEEAKYWKASHSRAALEDPDAPWVNHLAPKFAPK
jgi:hypothetical protein